jgi:hypothetical protein
MRKYILISIATSLLLAGCTGKEIIIRPENTLFSPSVGNSYSTVGLKDATTVRTIPVVGNVTEAFGNEMKSSGFAKEVYYPLRPDDNTEITLESKFKAEIDTHSGSAFVKSFITGFTMFILEPFLWYDFDYRFSGEVLIFKDGKMIKQTSAVSDATMSVKWLSLSDVASLEAETIIKLKKSLFNQLLNDIRK